MGRVIEERFVKDISGKRLVLPVLYDEKVYHHQVEIIKHNPWPRILPLEKRRINNQIRLYYRTDFQIPLKQYLTGTVLTREKFINILENIFITLSDCKRYFLYESSFLLCPDYIYINPVTEEVALLYIPMGTEDTLTVQIRTLIKELLRYIRPDSGGDSLEFNKTIADFQSRESVHLTELEQLVRELRFSRINSASQSPQSVLKPFELEPGRLDGINDQEKKKTLGDNKIKFMSLMALLQVISLLILMVFSDKLKALGDIKTTNTGIALIFTAINIFLINKLFGKTSFSNINKNKKAEERAKEWEVIVTNSLAKENKVIQ